MANGLIDTVCFEKLHFNLHSNYPLNPWKIVMNIDENSILNKIGIFFFLNTDIVIFFFLKSLNISFS